MRRWPAHRFRFDALLLSLSARPEVSKCEIQCLTASLELADANFTAQPAGFICESVLSAGGIIVPPEGYLNRVKAECDKRGMELIMDEAQTGLGKTGKLFGFQHEPGLKPGIIALSKHFGGGLPISAVCTTADVAKRAVGRGYFATRSHATDPLLCAAGEESLDIVFEEDMPGKAAQIERWIKSLFVRWRKSLSGSAIFANAVSCWVSSWLRIVRRAPANAETQKIYDYALDKGLIFQIRDVREQECHSSGSTDDQHARGGGPSDVDPL